MRIPKGFGIVLILIFFLSLFHGSVDASHVMHDFIDPNRSSFTPGQYRTGYHFQPPMNWINDPNGPLFYKGLYHLFYQYNPKGAVWGNIVWAHSVSVDMLNWVPLEPAIFPSKPFDIGGCWSGSATILPGNQPTILYTGIDAYKRQLQNMAVPKDLNDPYLREWIKPDYNPVINPGSWINGTAFRDPTTAWLGADGQWRVIVGSRKLGRKRGLAVLFKSRDFVHWSQAKHPLHSMRGSGMWECPDFFPIAGQGKDALDTSEYGEGVKHVFKVSLDLTRIDYYTLGKYIASEDRYVPDEGSVDNTTGLRYDYGNFYASKTFFDPAEKRRILWGWSNESDTAHDDTAKNWAGIQTIPRTLELDSNGRQLVQWPIKEFNTLRGIEAHVTDTNMKTASVVPIKGINSSEADVEVTFDLPTLEKAEPFNSSWTNPQELCSLNNAEAPGGIGPFGLFVLASGDMEERTAVFFRIYKAPSKYVILMCHDSSKSSFREEVWKQSFGGFVDFDIAKEKKIKLRSLIDNSVVESFGAEGKTCITSRVYPAVAVGASAYMYAFNGGVQDVNIEDLTAWEITKPRMNEVN